MFFWGYCFVSDDVVEKLGFGGLGKAGSTLRLFEMVEILRVPCTVLQPEFF